MANERLNLRLEGNGVWDGGEKFIAKNLPSLVSQALYRGYFSGLFPHNLAVPGLLSPLERWVK